MAKFDTDGCRLPETLFEAAAWHFSVVANCHRCRAQGVFDAPSLWWLFERKHWDTSFSGAARRLKCKACGGRALISSSRKAVPTIHFQMPTDRDWRKAVSRFRS